MTDEPKKPQQPGDQKDNGTEPKNPENQPTQPGEEKTPGEQPDKTKDQETSQA